MYLAVVLLYEEPEEPIITKVTLANDKLIEEAKALNITHPFELLYSIQNSNSLSY